MTPTLEDAFARLPLSPADAADATRRLREAMAAPPRAYHTPRHVEAMLTLLHAWTTADTDDGGPSAPLLAAALYHDAVYDPIRADNELRSAVLLHEELAPRGVPLTVLVRAAALILLTAHHTPPPSDADAVLLLDADLYVLGESPDAYAAYAAAIRTEYAHVSEDAWRTGRRAALGRFLSRPRLFHGDWPGRDRHEARARANLAAEIASLGG